MNYPNSIIDWKNTYNKKIFQSTLMIKNLSLGDLAQQLSNFSSKNIELNLTPLMNNLDLDLGQLEMFRDYDLILDGGWCNFFNDGFVNSEIKERQLNISKYLGNPPLRLFFGNSVGDDVRYLTRSIQNLTDEYPEQLFFFETHDQISSNYDWLASIANEINRINFGLVLDPVNVIVNEGRGIEQDLNSISRYVAHIHLKGLDELFEYTPVHNNRIEYFNHVVNECTQWSFAVEIEPNDTYTLNDLNDAYKYSEHKINNLQGQDSS